MAHFSLLLQEHMGIMRKIVLEELLNGHLLYVNRKNKINKNKSIIIINYPNQNRSHETRTRILCNASPADLQAAYNPDVYLEAAAAKRLHRKPQAHCSSSCSCGSFQQTLTDFPPLRFTAPMSTSGNLRPINE